MADDVDHAVGDEDDAAQQMAAARKAAEQEAAEREAADLLLQWFLYETSARDQVDRRRWFGGPNHVDQAHHLLEEWEALSDEERESLIRFFPDDLANDYHLPAPARAACHVALQDRDFAFDAPPWTLLRGYGQVYGSMDPAAAEAAVAHIVYPDDSVGKAEAYHALQMAISKRQAAIVIELPVLNHERRQVLDDGTTVVPPAMPVFHPVYDFLTSMAAAAPDTKLVISTHESHRADWDIIDHGFRLAWEPVPEPPTYSEQRRQKELPTLVYEPVLSRVAGIRPNRGAPHPLYEHRRTPPQPPTFESWRDPYSPRARGPHRSIAPGMN